MNQIAKMRSKISSEALEVLIIGAGFAGICLGKRLLDTGISNFLIVDKARKPGGTWFWNSYPGAACDVMSHFYCFSFAPNPVWSRKYSPWNEIRDYSEACVVRFGLQAHLRLEKEVRMSRFNELSKKWEVELTDGDLVETHHVIDGSGGLNVPLVPRIEGSARFAGEQWHSARWRHDVSLKGKSVAVIGSAASAVQIVPEIAKIARDVTVFQRSANYVIPRNDRRYLAIEKWCFRNLPGIRKLYRLFLFLRYEWLAYPIVKTSRENLPRRYAMWMFRRLLKKQIKDPDLRKSLTPDYPIGCKRVLISDDFYPALNRDNVHLVTDKIECITPAAVRTTSGTDHGADVLVYATGFDTQGHHVEQRVTGPAGRSLADAWADAPVAYEGCMVAGFPNYYFVTGPNTGVGSNSVIFMIEQAANFIIRCMDAAGPEGLIEPKQSAMDAYNAEIQQALSTTVWAESCHSWYKSDSGRITALYPYNAQTFRKRHRQFHRHHFIIHPVN
jgi:cation diffusion facilitator CzcD-associated flavoprotein CzcO